MAVEHPAIEKKKKAEDGPAGLIGGGFVKMLAVAEQRRERGEHKGHGRKQSDESCGEPQPPFAARDLAQAGTSLLRAECFGALKWRGIRFAGAETER